MIAGDQHELVFAALLAVCAMAIALDRTRVGNIVPAPAIMLIAMLILSNVGVLPPRSPVYHATAAIAVPVGVFLLLLRADLRKILRETKALLGLYLIGATASVVGITLAFFIVPVPHAAAVGATQVANLVGGTVNVVAVGQAVAFDTTAFSAMMAANAVVMNIYVVSVGIMASNGWLQRALPGKCNDAAPRADAPRGEIEPETQPRPLNMLDLAVLLAAAFGTYAILDLLLTLLGHRELIIIAASLVSLAVANLIPRTITKIIGDREIGTILMFLFFGTLGAQIDLTTFGETALAFAIFIAVGMAFHVIVMLAVGKLLRSSLGEVLIASLSGVAGPSTAGAMAASLGYPALITPGILCGLLGFAIATFVGLGFFHVVG